MYVVLNCWANTNASFSIGPSFRFPKYNLNTIAIVDDICISRFELRDLYVVTLVHNSLGIRHATWPTWYHFMFVSTAWYSRYDSLVSHTVCCAPQLFKKMQVHYHSPVLNLCVMMLQIFNDNFNNIEIYSLSVCSKFV